MITRELLKREIDKVQEEYFIALYKIIKAFEKSRDVSDSISQTAHDQKDWHAFIEKYAGCLEDSPIERGEQGDFETREEMIL
ncbi:MAG: hypothetical protein GY765_41040 [bacterium]|nr:hypothetical protein [bacterium]